MTEAALLHGTLLGQNMTLVGVLTLDFACSGKGEPLFGTGIGFHFGHNAVFLSPADDYFVEQGARRYAQNGLLEPLFLNSFGGQRNEHSLSFQLGHALHLTQILQLLGKREKKQLPSLFEDNRPAPKMHVGPHFGPFLKKIPGMFELKLKIVVVGIGPKTDLFNQILGRMGFDFLFFPFFFVLVFAIIGDSANGGCRRFGDQHQVQSQTFGHLKGLGQRIDALFYIFTDQSYLFGADIFIDRVNRFLGPAIELRVTYRLIDGDLLGLERRQNRLKRVAHWMAANSSWSIATKAAIVKVSP